MSQLFSGRRALWWILVLGLVVRVAYFVERRGEPDYRHPAVDAGYHDDWARTMVFGEEGAEDRRLAHFGDPAFDSTPYLRPPGFPYFLAAVYRVSGGSRDAAAIAQMLLGLAGVALAWAIGRRWLGAREAAAFAALMATHWSLLYFEGELHAPTLLIALELAAVYAVARAAEAPTARRWSLAAGIALGLATLTRPNIALFVPVFLAWLGWLARRPDSALGGHWRGVALPLVLAFAVSLVPSAVRNYRVSGEWIPVSSNFGINLYLGNHAGANGLISGDLGPAGQFKTCYDYPELIANLENELGRELTHGDVSAYFAERARAWIFGNPGAFLSLTLRKAGYFWGPAEVGHNKEVGFEHRRSKVLRFLPLPFWALLALASFGGVLFASRRSSGAARPDDSERDPDRGSDRGVGERELTALMVLLLVAFFLSVLPFFAGARYRVPALPFLAYLAALAVRAFGAGRVGGGGRAIGIAGAAALTITAVSLALGPSYAPAGERFHLDRGRAFFQTEDFEAARAEFATALEVAPGSAAPHLEMAILQHRLEELDGAREHYLETLRREPSSYLANFNLAFLLEQSGDTDGAERCFLTAEAGDPTSGAAAYNLANLYWRTSRARKAADALRRAVATEPRPEYRERLASLLAQGPPAVRNPGEAVTVAEALVRDSGRRVARHLATLADAYAAAERFGEAATACEEALVLSRSTAPALAAMLEQALLAYRDSRPYRPQ